MPPLPEAPSKPLPLSPEGLYLRGLERCRLFCEANGLTMPTVTPCPKDGWHFSVCAYYRPETENSRQWTSPGINICLPHCARPAGHEMSRNWSWPGNTTDRTPYGVLCHELAHHCDWVTGAKKWSYGSEYGETVMRVSGEAPISGYHPNPAEWFAEMMRVFITNHALLYAVRPRTWDVLVERWRPVSNNDWITELTEDVPERVLRAAQKKIVR